MKNPNQKAKTPFRFFECIALFMPTGKKASNLREFVELVKVVSPQVLFHHLHQFFLKGVFQPWYYPNDFAHWAAFGLEDFVLAEKLSNLDPYSFPDIENLRETIVDIIEEHMWESPIVPWARPGQEFFFNESYTIVVPTGVEAKSLVEFKKGMTQVNIGSVYYHFFESRLRLKKDVDDFSFWIEDNFGCPQLVKDIRNIDFYLYSLWELREKIVQLVKVELSRKGE